MRAEDIVTATTDWQGYRDVRRGLGDSNVRVTYFRGRLQLMAAPSRRHEKRKSVLGRFIETLMDEWGIAYEIAGALTVAREDLDLGFEPDESYWIKHVNQVSGSEEFNPYHDPPPDLIIEVEVTRKALGRMPIFATLGVPEVWCYSQEEGVRFHVLQSGSYAEKTVSPTFPLLPRTVLNEHLEKARATSCSEARRAWKEWLLSTPGPAGDKPANEGC